MRFSSFYIKRLFALFAVTALSLSFAARALPQEKQDKDKNKAQQVSEGERKAAQKINDAKDTPAKLAAASEFVTKYPKSSLRPKVARYIVDQISAAQDPAQKISLAESYLGTFAEASETRMLYPTLINAYVNAKRVDDAFNAAGPWLELNPNEVDVLYLLSVTGADEARRRNPKYVKQSQQYGAKAIELIEADKRPEDFDAERWNKNKAIWLPQLYQSMGLLSMLGGNNTDALSKLEKAAQLNPADPFNYVLISSIKNDQYNTGAAQLKGMAAGAGRDEAEKKLLTQLDEIIDLYAHALGLMEGKPQFQPLHDQLLPGLESYYKYRHNNSTTGMQDLINKYKQPQSLAP